MATHLTRRLAVGDTPDPSFRTWNECWGDSWGDSWRQAFPFTVLNLTRRVALSPSIASVATVDSRLELEGDESGLLLLEGDMQSGTDALSFDGDEATSTVAGTNITKRVPAFNDSFSIVSLFQLEGDESGALLLEGDMQAGDDVLLLEGDEAGVAGTILTKRVGAVEAAAIA